MNGVPRGVAWIAPLVCALGAVLLAYSITQPPARIGTGSTISLHELFDLLLAGNLPLPIPRWIGLFGYAPALGGALVLLAEALPTRSRRLVRWMGCGIAGIALVILITQGPWVVFSGLGAALWLGIVGMVLIGIGMFTEFMLRTPARHDRRTRTPQTQHAGPDQGTDHERGDHALFSMRH